jgi:hypothetical protein
LAIFIGLKILRVDQNKDSKNRQRRGNFSYNRIFPYLSALEKHGHSLAKYARRLAQGKLMHNKVSQFNTYLSDP